MREFLNSFTKLEFEKVRKSIQRYATSAVGAELVAGLMPSANRDEVLFRLSSVSEMKHLMEEYEAPPLEPLPDIRLALQHAQIDNYVLRADELRDIGVVLGTSKRIQSYFKQKKDKFPILQSVVSGVRQNQILEFNIGRAIDENGEVKDSATKELASLRKRLVEQKDSLRRQLESILKSLAGKEWAQEEIITTRDGRMVIPVKTEHKNMVKGFIHSSSSSGATVFIEPSETLDANNDLRTIQFQEQREIEKILRELTNQVREFRNDLIDGMKALGELDFLVAKAKYSLEVLGTEPVIPSGRRLRIEGARHPLLLQRHKREEVVPFSVAPDDGYHTLLVTGPNAGGKTVALKTVGILSLMVQSGCHVPAAAECEFPIFTEIFVDIGDEQSIENDLSSFSSHLKNLNEVLENATSTSLILLDEIGSGTDPAEGSALAAAVLERLTARESFTVATTHQGSLKAFAYQTSGIANAAMEFDQVSLRPTYRFRLGTPGSSYAIEMAERMNLPGDIVARARELSGSDATRAEKMLLELEKAHAQARMELEALAEQRRKADILVKDYENRLKSFNQEVNAKKAEALTEASQIVSRGQSAVENAVRQIREQQAGADSIASAKREIQEQSRRIADSQRELGEKAQPTKPFRSGDRVRLKDTGTVGEVIHISESGDCTILVGQIRLDTKAEELEHFGGHPDGNVQTVASTFLSEQSFSGEIDLRGMRAEEAIEAVDKTLDTAMLKGLRRIDIIHGKGTGVLRKGISEYLKKHKSVKSFRMGEWNEGGSGVTVVELK